MRKKWNYDACYEISKTCKTRVDFINVNASAYNAAKKEGWIDEWYPRTKKNMDYGYWTYEKCREIALKYTSLIEFQNANKSAYTKADKNGWLKDFTWLEMRKMGNYYWTYKRCKQEAKKYKTRNEFRIKSVSAYNKAIKKKWIDDFYWLEPSKTQKKWDYDACYSVAENYKTRTDLKNGNCVVYKVALENNWLDDYYWMEIQKNPYNSDMDNVYAYLFLEQHAVYIGRTINPKGRNTSHRVQNGTVSKFSKKHGVEIPKMTILESCLSLEQGQIRENYYVEKYKSEGWTVLNKAKTGKGSGSLGTLGGRLTKDKCREVAKSCKNRSELERKHGGVYNKSLRFGWLDEFFPKAA